MLVNRLQGSRVRKTPKVAGAEYVPREPETPTSVALGEEYLRKRNQILDLKYKREAMNLALDRDQSIEKRLGRAATLLSCNRDAPEASDGSRQALESAG